MAGRKGRTVNPKFKGSDTAQVRVDQGGTTGGISESENRKRVWGTAVMLKNQLRRNKSGSSPL